MNNKYKNMRIHKKLMKRLALKVALLQFAWKRAYTKKFPIFFFADLEEFQMNMFHAVRTYTV